MPESQTQVTIHSREAISSAHESSWRSLPSPLNLSPLDQLVAPFIPVAVVFVYAQPIDHDPILPTERLRGAISRVLDDYSHLTGRLRIDAKSSLPQIDRLGAGAELLEATCSEPLRAFRNSGGEVLLLRLPGGGNDLLAPYDMDIESVCAGPVFTIQHTRFSCGGVALGIRILHTINDAGGFFKLVSDLAEVYRASSATKGLSSPPQTTPYLSTFALDASVDERARIKAFKPTLYHLESEEQATKLAAPDVPAPDPPAEGAPLSPNTGRVLRFTSPDLARIKAEATDPGAAAGEYVSTFDALNAFLHQRVYRARHRLRQSNPALAPLSHPDLLSPVDVRRKLPALSSGYIGNAIFTTYAHFETAALLEGPLHPIAREVHRMTRQSGVANAQEIESTIKWIALNDKSKIKNGFRLGNASLMLSQWNKIDMYRSATFDEGVRPSLIAPPFTPISLLDGLGYYLPAPAEDKGAIDVYLALSEDIWNELDIKLS